MPGVAVTQVPSNGPADVPPHVVAPQVPSSAGSLGQQLNSGSGSGGSGSGSGGSGSGSGSSNGPVDTPPQPAMPGVAVTQVPSNGPADVPPHVVAPQVPSSGPGAA
jgi:hypothetical protein